MSYRTRTFGLFFLVITIGAVPARADLVISIGSTSVAEGGIGSVDVDITNGGQSAVQLNNYAFQLVITANSGTLTQLAFSAPTSQQLGYLSDPSLSPHYVLLGDSTDAQPPPFIGGTSLTNTPNDTFNASDSTYSGNQVTISGGETLLLAVLPLTTVTQLSPRAGDSFTISLSPGSGSGSMGTFPNLNPTYFDVIDFDPTSPTFGAELSAVPFRGTAGTATIISTSVPEPSSLVLVAFVAAIGSVSYLWRWRVASRAHEFPRARQECTHHAMQKSRLRL